MFLTTTPRNLCRVYCKDQVVSIPPIRKREMMIQPKQIPFIASKAKTWAYLNGLIMRSPGIESGAIHAPIAVLPCPFPKSCFEKAVEVMPLMNDLYHAVSSDHEFLVNTLKPAAQFDEFTAKLLEIYMEVYQKREGKEVLELGIHRSDYMLDEPTGRLLQVELNTIASSFGPLSYKVYKLHSFLSTHLDQLVRSFVDLVIVGVFIKDRSRIIEHQATKEIVAAMAKAHEVLNLPDSKVLMVATHDDSNMYDQEYLTMGLWEDHGIGVIRKPLNRMMKCSELDESGNLVVDGVKISVAYFRAGYSPVHYPTQKEWDIRRMIELSTATKCPSISYHLTGTKKIQQELARPGVVERFLSPEDSSKVREFFAGLWGLDDLEDPTVASIIEEAIANPDGFVLKPQREGGGNNLYGEEAAEVLSKKQGLGAYILMERIRPQVHNTLLLMNELYLTDDTVSELGIYGTYIRKGSEKILNKAAGHLLRTKVSTSNEGGVAAGYAVLDSPYLID